MAALEIHEICYIFPEMSAADLKVLANDIAVNGLHEPVWTYRGQVIDGRNRLAACHMAGVEPTTREWDGEGSLVRFVLSLNLHRRHLTAGQRAGIAAEIKPRIEAEIAEEKKTKGSEAGKQGGRGHRKGLGNNSQTLSEEPKGRKAREEAAAAVGVNPRYVSDAELIRERSPEVADAVKRGELTIPQAKKKVGIHAPKANGRAPKANGDAPTQPAGQSRINGQIVDDPPDVAKARAAGKIPEGVVVEVTEADEPTSVEVIREEIEEESAHRDDALSDDDWLETLPLHATLEGTQRRRFTADALDYRRLEPARKTFAYHAGRALRSRPQGIVAQKTRWYLKLEHPRKWVRCASPEAGGCGGSGAVPMFGECPTCHGRGYHAGR